MANTTRRALLGHVAGAAIVSFAPCVAVAMPVAETDPCLAFVDGWTEAGNAMGAAAGEGDASRYHAFCERARDGDVPDATTAQGAAAALRKILDFDDIEDQDANLLRAALAFLERGA